MTTSLWTLAWETASRWLCATWLRWVEYRSSAITRDLLKHRLSASVTSTLMAEFGTCVSSAFQRPTTHPSADVFRFDILFGRAKVRSELATRSLTLVRSLLSRAASISARVTTTVEVSLALTRAHGGFINTLVADGRIVGAAALAFDGNLAQTSATGAGVTQFVARMATG